MEFYGVTMLDYPSKSNHTDIEVRKRFEKAYDLYETDRDKAIDLLQKNLDEGCLSSMVLLGAILSDGNEFEREQSIELFRLASDNDDPSGCRDLAYCYAIGLNIVKDKEKAVELYVKSALMGNARSACNAGVMFEFGNGVEKDEYEAFQWYSKSAEGGCTRGMTNLGEFYLLGKGTTKNIPLAIEWFTRSGSARATYRLSEIYLSEEGFKDEVKGLALLKKSAEMGYSRGMVTYAKLIENKDPERAISFLNKAATKGNSDAIAALEEKGLPIPPSRRKRLKKAQ